MSNFVVCGLLPTGRLYHQYYAELFHVKNGKITLFREYYNSAAVIWAFTLNEGNSFHGDNKK